MFKNISIDPENEAVCPLSPLLFTLVIEILAIAIRSSVNIHGFKKISGEEKIALYADHVLFLFLGDTQSYLSAAMEAIENFGQISSLNIN